MTSLYQRILRNEFAQLSKPLQSFHSRTELAEATGRLNVENGGGSIRPIIAWIAGLPGQNIDVPVRLKVVSTATGERWERWFGEKRLISIQREWQGMLLETIGPWSLAFELCSVDGGIRFVQKRNWCMGLPWLPQLSPRIQANVTPEGQGWTVDVCVSFPFVGQVCRYRGVLKPQ